MTARVWSGNDRRTSQRGIGQGWKLAHAFLTFAVFFPYLLTFFAAVSMSVFDLSLLGIVATIRHGMWNSFTIVHTVHPLVDELLFLCLIERIE